MSDNRRGLLCLSLAGPDAAALIRRAEALIDLADLVELRLDSMQDPDIRPFCRRFATPVLATNRPTWEGGAFAGPEEERLALLTQAMSAGAAYVDIELRTEASRRDAFLTAARAAGKWALVSWHDFRATPDTAALTRIFARMRATAARSGKIVTTAENAADAARLLGLLAHSSPEFPLSAFAMGAPGGITRLSSLFLGGHIVYASADAALATAPGQMELRRLRDLCDLFEAKS